jgi:hypothetical protein
MPSTNVSYPVTPGLPDAVQLRSSESSFRSVTLRFVGGLGGGGVGAATAPEVQQTPTANAATSSGAAAR